MTTTDKAGGGIEELRESLALAEAKLKQSEDKFIRLTDATYEAVFVHENGKPLETNGNFTKLFGYSLADLKRYKGGGSRPLLPPNRLHWFGSISTKVTANLTRRQA